MGQALILETTSLVDLEREALRDEVGPAHRFLERNGDQELCITLTSAGELWIPAVSLTHDLPLVTRNANHFKRVPGLAVVTYTEPAG